MLARALRRVLLIELLFYVAAGCGLVRFAGWEWPDAGLAVLAVALALRALGIAATSIIAARHASPAPRGHRLGFAGRLRLFFSELGAYIVIFNLYQPFEELLRGTEKLQPLPHGRLPVLLLHGYMCNRGCMLALRRYLRARGVSAHTHNLEPVYADIDAYADGLARRIAEIRNATGADQLVILAYSMGGLAARAYMRKYGARRVAKLITLGTPHYGTAMARLIAGESGRQIVPGNTWLQRLNADAPGLPVVSLFSYQDSMVVPQESAALAGAKIVRLSGIGHLGMPLSRRVGEIVLEEIRAAGG
jgi:hypothetical protein